MKRIIFNVTFPIFIYFFYLAVFPSDIAYSQTTDYLTEITPSTIFESTQQITVAITKASFPYNFPFSDYNIEIAEKDPLTGTSARWQSQKAQKTTDAGGKETLKATFSNNGPCGILDYSCSAFTDIGKHEIMLSFQGNRIRNVGSIQVQQPSCNITVTPKETTRIVMNKSFDINVTNFTGYLPGNYDVIWDNILVSIAPDTINISNSGDGKLQKSLDKVGNHTFIIGRKVRIGSEWAYCSGSVYVYDQDLPPGTTIAPTPTTSSTGVSSDPCAGASANGLKSTDPGYADTPAGKCHACIDPPKSGSWTALGCVDTTPNGFVSWFLTGAIGIGGGIAFLIMLWGVFTIITSTGNPDKLNQGREIIVSAIVGLIMIIFSVFLLKVIGVDILKIPGFG